jgi:uncharacterized membrane protein
MASLTSADGTALTPHRADAGPVREPVRPEGWWRDERWVLALAIATYAVLFSFLCSMRYLSSYLGDPDYALFDQGFYTTLKSGTPFVNTFEGHSSFGKHVTPIFYVLLPFYAIRPGIPMLVVLQSTLLGLAAWPLFLIARERLSAHAALIVALLYLLYHPLHGVNYDQYNPNSSAVLPLMFALHFFLRRRWVGFWIASSLALSCKEDVSFVLAFWGLFTMGLATRKWWGHRTEPGPTRLAAHGIAMLVVGLGWLWLCLYAIVPAFETGHEAYGYFAERYPHLGQNLPEVVSTLVLHPFRVAGFLLQKGRILYVLEVFLPLAYVPLCSPSLLWMTIPTFAINTLSLFGMHSTGDRYTAYIIPFLFGATVTALGRMTPSSRAKALRWMSALTILCTLFINNTPLRIGFRVPRITDHQRRVVAVARSIPPSSSISTQIGLFNHVCQRVHAYSGYREGVDYIFVDQTSKWYREQAHWDAVLPNVLAAGRYVNVYDDDGIRLYRRMEVPPR